MEVQTVRMHKVRMMRDRMQRKISVQPRCVMNIEVLMMEMQILKYHFVFSSNMLI